MINNNNNNSSGKRKMKDPIPGPSDQSFPSSAFAHFNLNHQFPPPPPPALSYAAFGSSFPPPSTTHQFASTSNAHPQSHSHVQQILNAAAPTIRPFSFTSLLMGDYIDDDNEEEEEEEENPLVTEMRSQTEQLNQIISLHTDILQKAVSGMLERQQKSLHRAADEQAKKKLKNKEAQVRMKSAQNQELERQVHHYKEEGERLSAHMRHLEDQTNSLKLSLDRVYEAQRRRAVGPSQEESESSTPLANPPDDHHRPVNLDCRICSARLATTMMWPCRHVSVCKWCDRVTNACPECGAPKRNSFQFQVSN